MVSSSSSSSKPRPFLRPLLLFFAAVAIFSCSLLPGLLEGRRSSSRGGDWDRRTKQKMEVPMCIQGRLMPRLYLLGHAKCGTTSVAEDLRRAGLQWLAVSKEAHLFDELCGYDKGKFLVDKIAGCPVANQTVRVVRATRNCSSEPQPTVLESSPSNARLPGLPSLLSRIYGSAASRLGFVLLLREPLSCMQSYWYDIRSNYNDSVQASLPSFKSYLRDLWPAVQEYRRMNYTGMESDGAMNVVYRSFYSLSLAPWLQAFHQEQFLILPMRLYLFSTSLADKAVVLRRLASKFGASIDEGTASHLAQRRRNRGSHGDLLLDLGADAVASWYAEHLSQDLRRLAALLVAGGGEGRGVEVQGYSGGADAGEMFAYLCSTLPCLA